MSDFVHAQGIKTVYAGGGGWVRKWQNSVHVVVKCPLRALNQPRTEYLIIHNSSTHLL